MRKVGRPELLSLAALLLLALPAVLPLLRSGLSASFDGRTHVLRLGALQRAVAEGVLLPHWLGEMQLGHGYPLFLFYPIGGYALALLPALAGLPLDYAYNLGLLAAVLLAAVGAWLLGRDLFGGSALAALVSGVAYTYAPYLLVNVYVRGALPEALGQALLPWVLWSGRRVATGARPAPYALLLAGSLAALMLAHSLLLMLAVPYLLVYLAILWWQGGRRGRTLAWLALGLTAAAGASAFFWLPMLANRQYLTAAGYEAARLGWLPDNAWSWQNFLDLHLFYEYAYDYPVQLGLLQAALALGGLLLARRRDGEWLFFGLSAVGGALLIGSWALPLWLSSDVLAAVQFPWRLLSLVSLSCAMLTGGWVCRLQPVPRGRVAGVPAVPGVPAAAAAVAIVFAIVAVIVVAQSPRGLAFYPPMGNAVGAASLAAHEVEKGVLTADAASSVKEFRPRWSLPAAAPADTEAAGIRPSSPPLELPAIGQLEAGPEGLAMQVEAPVTATLLFQDYYYPSWRVTGPAGVALPTYAGGELGLLAVDVPPGSYRLEQQWRAPPWAQAGALLSLATLALLALFYGLYLRSRWALAPALLLTVCLAGWAYAPPTAGPVQAPQGALEGLGLQLLGYRVAPPGNGPPAVDLYWYVQRAPPADLRLRVQLRAGGQIVQEYVQRPYYNQAGAAGWMPGLLVRDGLQVALPAGVPAGAYTLALGLESVADDPAHRPTTVAPVALGELYVPATPALRREGAAGDIAVWESVAALERARVVAGGAELAAGSGRPPVVAPGQDLCIELQWRPLAPSTRDLRGFVHLVDAQGTAVAQHDQVPGPDLWPASLWLPGVPFMDSYCFRIPADAVSGVVWPNVGLYDRATLERLSVTGMPGSEGAAGDGSLVLPPLKIVRPAEPVAWPLQPAVRYGDVAELAGAGIELPEGGLFPGSAITVTLGWRSLAPAQGDGAGLTRFVHLYSPALGMAAQADGIPQAGRNPTWSWAPGEQVTEQVVLTVAEGAQPGRYQLAAGLYDPAADNARVAAVDGRGNRLEGDMALLGEVEILPRAAGP